MPEGPLELEGLLQLEGSVRAANTIQYYSCMIEFIAIVDEEAKKQICKDSFIDFYHILFRACLFIRHVCHYCWF